MTGGTDDSDARAVQAGQGVDRPPAGPVGADTSAAGVERPPAGPDGVDTSAAGVDHTPAGPGEADTSAAVRPDRRRWVGTAVAIAFGLFYAYDLFEAISNLLGVAQLNGLAAEAGVPPVVPWTLPIVVVAIPPVAYLLALLLGRRRNVGIRALLLLAGLAVVAAVTLSITGLA